MKHAETPQTGGKNPLHQAMHEATQLSDSELVAKIKQSDRHAMRVLYERHSPALSAFIRNKLNDPIEVADVVHDAFIEVWSKADRFQGRSSVRSWIYSIARNKAVDRVRKQSRVIVSEPDDSVADDAPHAETVITHAQDAERLQLCLDQLPEVQRAAITLSFYEEMTYREISEVEGVSEGTVKSRVFHAKKLLQHCLSK